MQQKEVAARQKAERDAEQERLHQALNELPARVTRDVLDHVQIDGARPITTSELATHLQTFSSTLVQRIREQLHADFDPVLRQLPPTPAPEPQQQPPPPQPPDSEYQTFSWGGDRDRIYQVLTHSGVAARRVPQGYIFPW